MKGQKKAYGPPIVISGDFWIDAQLSVARYNGSVEYHGNEYVICDKDGRTLKECGTIEPGDPCDLILRDWVSVCRAVGRERFLEIIRATSDLDEAMEMAGIENPETNGTE